MMDQKKPSSRPYERIGVLLVHGVGEQGALQHLEQTTAQLVEALKAMPDQPKVDIRTMSGGGHGPENLRGVPPYSPDPTVAIDLRFKDREATLELNEVWWADLDEPDDWRGTIRFWLWGLGQWIAKRYEHSRRYDLKHRAMPRFPWEQAGALRETLMHVFNRAQLFLISCFFLMLVGTWSLAKYVVSFFAPKSIPPTILVQYIGDIKLYQQRQYRAGAPLADRGLPPRTAIMKRMVNALAGMALGDYDRWYILAHSLGSVVAWDSLNQAPYALANCLSPDIVDQCRDGRVLKVDGEALPKDEDDRESIRPPRPRWIGANEVVDRSELFTKLRGLCTYGSPLDKFAFLWPRIVAQYRDQAALGKDFEWINIFDPTDPVAGAIDAFDGIEKERNALSPRPWPANYGYRAYPWLLLSHINYLSFKPGKPGRFVNRLADWVLSGNSFDSTDADQHAWMRPGVDRFAIRRRYGSQLAQWAIVGGTTLLAFTAVCWAISKKAADWFSAPASQPASPTGLSDAAADAGPAWTWFEGLLQWSGAIAQAIPAALFIVITSIIGCGFILRLGEEIRHRRPKPGPQASAQQQARRSDKNNKPPEDWPKVA